METHLVPTRTALICVDVPTPTAVQELAAHFCGTTIITATAGPSLLPDGVKTIFVGGDVAAACTAFGLTASQVLVIEELAHNYEELSGVRTVTLGQVPVRIPGIGVFYRGLYPEARDFFGEITTAHEFQVLTESNKPDSSYRKGIYITPVKQLESKGKEDDEAAPAPAAYEFKLLRCSTNLSGPTDNVRPVDEDVIGKANELSTLHFDDPAPLNHVLAQVYENKVVVTDGKRSEKKAKIVAHSDKTKDMPRNGVMSFVTFYRCDPALHYTREGFDVCYNGRSVLTSLLFRLKGCVADESLPKEVWITLYPGSLLLVPLEANRLYTHEIRPSRLPVEKIPTRLGYVIRCSKTDAVHRSGVTSLKLDAHGDKLLPLRDPTPDDFHELKSQYLRENATIDIFDYGTVPYSMNRGDYTAPIL